MNIILVSNRLSKPRTVTLSMRQLALAALALACLGAAAFGSFYYFVLRHAVEDRNPLLADMVRAYARFQRLTAHLERRTHRRFATFAG